MARTAWMQSGEPFDLLADLRRGIEENPALAVRADGDRLLRSRRRANAPGANAAAVWTATVPLRKPAACRRPQHADAHESALPKISPQQAPARAQARSRCGERFVDCLLELTVELHRSRVGEGKDLRHDEPGHALARIQPVVRVEDAAPADRARAPAVRPRLHVEHVSEPPADLGAGKE